MDRCTKSLREELARAACARLGAGVLGPRGVLDVLACWRAGMLGPAGRAAGHASKVQAGVQPCWVSGVPDVLNGSADSAQWACWRARGRANRVVLGVMALRSGRAIVWGWSCALAVPIGVRWARGNRG
jgi:hypothetical protein